MTAYLSWKFLHLLTFVFWVGTDMGVYIAARRSTDDRLSFETRATLLHVALRIELLPRTMWKAALPLGAMLAADLGLLPIPGTGLALVWLFSLGWWAISMGGAWWYDQPRGRQLARITSWLTGLVGVTLILVAVLSWLGRGPFIQGVPWLYLKVGLYGLINLVIIWMLAAFEPMGAAFGRLAVEGSTHDVEAMIKATMTRSTLIIWATYLLIVIVGFIGTTRLPA